MGASSRTYSGHRSARRSSSPPVRDAAREEGRRRGHDGRVTYLHGDFVDLADLVGPAEIVTLDRVINVYPGWNGLPGSRPDVPGGCSAWSIRATPAW